MEFVASLFQGRTAAAQCGLFTHKSVPVIFEPPCNMECENLCFLCAVQTFGDSQKAQEDTGIPTFPSIFTKPISGL